ncbi:hypothetical protein J8273_0295 [Carpediemonas membranifera]|uniref:Uncharacterized protein n=1 Tax=Carpediemonas membranifera TaxID=201153 RepID=A0A8J6E0G2_9EUKA|nr:hypothetical protein J8273_0295 [Carpediemonas membranifera]|eukprot:KAG9395079.1 hypothetical protein J8273_0295 [Carpediemonas membranifera]
MIIYVTKDEEDGLGNDKLEIFNAECYCNLLLDAIQRKFEINTPIIDLFASSDPSQPTTEGVLPGERVFLTAHPTELASQFLADDARYVVKAVTTAQREEGSRPTSRGRSREKGRGKK